MQMFLLHSNTTITYSQQDIYLLTIAFYNAIMTIEAVVTEVQGNGV